MNPRTWIAIGLAAGSTVGACYRYDPTYCGNLDGHATCRDLGLGQFCSLCDFERDGCVNERPSADCLAPFEIPGETEASSGSSGSETGEPGTSGSSSSGSGSETGSSGSSGEAPCAGPEDCSGSTPFCNPLGECVSCDAMENPDEACASLDSQEPLCVGQSCVACTATDTIVCDGQLRLCDVETNECVDCTEHAQCSSGACQLDVGLCFPEDVVVHVDGDGGQDFTSVSAAVASFNDRALGVVVIHERTGAAPYSESIVVDAGKVLALLAAPGEAPVLAGLGVNPSVRVQGSGTTLYLEALEVSDGNSFGMLCDGARVDVRRGRIVQNSGGGVLAQGSCTLSIENSFIGGTNDTDALDVQESTASVLYTTLAASAMIAESPAALRCDGTSTVQVRNAILIGASTAPELDCSGADVRNSASESPLAGEGNVAVGNLNVTWFNGFVTGDFSLTTTGGTVFDDIARWEAGDPATDIDGDARPAVDGSPDHAGADKP